MYSSDTNPQNPRLFCGRHVQLLVAGLHPPALRLCEVLMLVSRLNLRRKLQGTPVFLLTLRPGLRYLVPVSRSLLTCASVGSKI